MKLLHTGDWHMGAKLGRLSRAKEINQTLKEIAGLLEARRIDVMIVAGDLFRSPHMDKAEIGDAVKTLRDVFGPFLKSGGENGKGGAIVAITGNHDSEISFTTLRDTLALAPGVTDAQGVSSAGRFHLATTPDLLKLADGAGNVVQFVLMPYPNAAYLRGETARANDNASRNAAIANKYRAALEQLTRERLDETRPAVLVSHIHVRGVNPNRGTAWEVSENDDVVFETGDIPGHFAYAAFGHIHDAAQFPLANAPHVRYCGSIARLDAGERENVKSVTVFDIGSGGDGKASAIETIPLQSILPIHEICVEDCQTLPTDLCAAYPHINPERDLVKLIVHFTSGVDNVADVCGKLQAAFPCWYSLNRIAEQPDTHDKEPVKRPDITKVEENVRNYIAARYPVNMDKRRKEPFDLNAVKRNALLELADTLLRECRDEAAGIASVSSEPATNEGMTVSDFTADSDLPAVFAVIETPLLPTINHVNAQEAVV